MTAPVAFPPLRLTIAELIDLTGRRRASDQAEWIRARYGCPAHVNAAGECVVIRAHIEAAYKPAHATGAAKPDDDPTFADRLRNPDFLPLKTLGELAESARVASDSSFEDVSAVYVLFDAFHIPLYVGQSRQVATRIRRHCARNQIALMYASIVECPEDGLNSLEAFYIDLLRPPRNRRDVVGQFEDHAEEFAQRLQR